MHNFLRPSPRNRNIARLFKNRTNDSAFSVPTVQSNLWNAFVKTNENHSVFKVFPFPLNSFESHKRHAASATRCQSSYNLVFII